MSFASKVLYTGDGVIKQFNIPFPFMSATHVRVFVNETLQLNPMNYTLSGSTVTFGDAPEIDAAIEIKRNTSPTATLVDFVDGSVLNENDLDTAYLHNYYLLQETTDSFNELINEALISVATGAGITEVNTSDVIAALVNEMLNDSAAADLQQRVNDIDTNAEAIVQLGTDLQVQVNTLAQGTAAVIYIQPGEPVPGVGGIPDPILDGARWYDSDDNNKPYIYDQVAVAWISIEDPRIGQAVTDISVLQTDVSNNAAAVVTEQVARSNADGAIASELALLGAQNGAQTAFIIDTSTVKIDTDTGDTLATRFSTITADKDANAAAIITEQTARISGDSANASDITALTARVTTAEGDIVTNAADIVTEQSVRASADTAMASDITGLQSTINLRSRTFLQATAPTADNVGDLWIDSDDNKLYRWNGSSWANIQDAAVGGNASAITALDTRVTTNEGSISSQASSITTLQSDVTTLDGRVDSAEVTISSNTSAIVSNDGELTTLFAKYGVTLNVNGYISGFAQHNNGQTGSFVILADQFSIVNPSALWLASTAYAVDDIVRPTSPNSRVFKCITAGTSGASEPTWDTVVGNNTNDNTAVWVCVNDAELVPFEVVGDKITMNGDVSINGSLLLNGSVVGSALVAGTIGSTQIGANAITTTQLNANAVTADKITANAVTAGKINVTTLAAITADLGAITAGSLTLNTTGFLKGGQTAYNTGTGFFLGYDTADYKFSIGDGGTDNFITWDGTSLVVRGNISIGSYAASNTLLLSADTERSFTDGAGSWSEQKKFEINRPGSIRVTFDMRMGSTTGGVVEAAQARVLVDGVVKFTASSSSSTYGAKSTDITLTDSAQYVTIELREGTRDPIEPLETACYIRNARIKADKSDGESVITN